MSEHDNQLDQLKNNPEVLTLGDGISVMPKGSLLVGHDRPGWFLSFAQSSLTVFDSGAETHHTLTNIPDGFRVTCASLHRVSGLLAYGGFSATSFSIFLQLLYVPSAPSSSSSSSSSSQGSLGSTSSSGSFSSLPSASSFSSFPPPTVEAQKFAPHAFLSSRSIGDVWAVASSDPKEAFWIVALDGEIAVWRATIDRRQRIKTSRQVSIVTGSLWSDWDPENQLLYCVFAPASKHASRPSMRCVTFENPKRPEILFECEIPLSSGVEYLPLGFRSLFRDRSRSALRYLAVTRTSPGAVCVTEQGIERPGLFKCSVFVLHHRSKIDVEYHIPTNMSHGYPMITPIGANGRLILYSPGMSIKVLSVAHESLPCVLLTIPLPSIAGGEPSAQFHVIPTRSISSNSAFVIDFSDAKIKRASLAVSPDMPYYELLPLLLSDSQTTVDTMLRFIANVSTTCQQQLDVAFFKEALLGMMWIAHPLLMEATGLPRTLMPVHTRSAIKSYLKAMSFSGLFSYLPSNVVLQRTMDLPNQAKSGWMTPQNTDVNALKKFRIFNYKNCVFFENLQFPLVRWTASNQPTGSVYSGAAYPQAPFASASACKRRAMRELLRENIVRRLHRTEGRDAEPQILLHAAKIADEYVERASAMAETVASVIMSADEDLARQLAVAAEYVGASIPALAVKRATSSPSLRARALLAHHGLCIADQNGPSAPRHSRERMWEDSVVLRGAVAQKSQLSYALRAGGTFARCECMASRFGPQVFASGFAPDAVAAILDEAAAASSEGRRRPQFLPCVIIGAHMTSCPTAVVEDNYRTPLALARPAPNPTMQEAHPQASTQSSTAQRKSIDSLGAMFRFSRAALFGESPSPTSSSSSMRESGSETSLPSPMLPSPTAEEKRAGYRPSDDGELTAAFVWQTMTQGAQSALAQLDNQSRGTLNSPYP
jgi:hypothetical protein